MAGGGVIGGSLAAAGRGDSCCVARQEGARATAGGAPPVSVGVSVSVRVI